MPVVYEEGELALLHCNTQSFSGRFSTKFTWFRKTNLLQNGNQPLPIQSDKYAQLGNLLLIAQINRNDSGIYVCQVKTSVGEEQLELELAVKG